MKKITLITTVSLLIAAPAIQAGDAKAGKTKAVVCTACHGPEGKSNNTMWPNLAGQQKGYLIKAMKDFRDGKRNDPLMTPMAKPLSDEDIENLAEYFSGLGK
ncbi:cytochrome c [Porticoccaceae bacterium LTM1]|nr:cytochrome c [Porticoccaceae bacterium LTM1]